MKRLLLIASMLFSVAYGQVCADDDTVRSNSVTLITANSARINGTTTHFTGAVTSLQLKYVRVGQTDTVTSTGASALRNITGLQAATAYYYYYKTICGSGTRSQTIGAYTFTTLANTILYAPERPTVFNHLKVDSSFIVPEGDTVVGREPSTRSQIRYKTSDNTFYGYYPNCTCWRALAIDSSGIIALLDGKVDSVTVSGDSLFYWKVGVSYGYILPSLANTWQTDGNAGIDTSTQFLGTTDNVDLVIKTNNTRQLTVNVNGAIGIGSTPDYGTSGYLLKTNGSGSAPSYISQASVTASLSSLVAATATNDINNANLGQTWRWNTLTSGPGLSIQSSTTAATPGQNLVLMNLAGANASANRTTYTLAVGNSHSGTNSSNYSFLSQATTGVNTIAGQFESSGTSTASGIRAFAIGAGANVAGYFSASTGSSNQAIYVDAGSVNLNPLTASLPLKLDASKSVTSAAIDVSTADVTGVLPLANGGTNSTDYRSATVTFTNKRWTARVGSTTSSATPTINTDNVDVYKLTAQTADITSFTTNLSGTPVDGDILEIQVTGTAARAITWGSSFVSTTVTLPTTTVTTATLTVIFQYYTTSSYGNNKWHVVNYY